MLLKIDAVADRGFCGEAVDALNVGFLAGEAALAPSSSPWRFVPVAGEGSAADCAGYGVDGTPVLIFRNSERK